ncbi:hypothetical protein [Pseudoxanthomonas winnipegensis]|uniref:hypothetical protein n=1 Tax=Pseudoxanthomonas winnipegensis TaxID=2480810 RepID=UPI00104080C2|nr:hypothetical protein [Pseudoxanthomonas winnipegensis]TBV69360.1 hypothetical protein EYC45_19550 [Pseudoxanthomonas winnipegensis]
MANPYIKPYKVHFIDKMLNWIGSTFIGKPEDLTDGRFRMLPGFYHRFHRRQNIRKADLKLKRVLTATHGFRMEFCHRLAKVMGLGLGGVAVLIALLVSMVGGAK